MSLHRGNHTKKTVGLIFADTTEPNINVKGISAEAKAIKHKHRSPFGFCGPRRAKV